jgi:dimethylhistidine N-methyltransferase
MSIARQARRQSRAQAPALQTGGAPLGAAQEIVDGLTAAEASVSPKFLYDALGSRLFEAITELPEYYPTRTERAIFESHIGSIARAVGEAPVLIELGAGNGEKAAALFDVLRPAQYVAVDISAGFLERSIAALQRAHPQVPMSAVCADITAGIRLPDSVKTGRRLFMYLGSSIGNFDPAQAEAMLTDIRANCRPGEGLLIGVDLVKPAAVLEAAYDDALGVTAAFNLNLLNHLNALIGANFEVRNWKHLARFNERKSRMEMHLEAQRELLVAWPGGSRHFREGERIHTENSYKYALPDFTRLLERAGFARVRAWTDDRDWFALCHAVA